MLAYIARRIVLGILTIGAISLLAFFISQLPPGDAVERHMDKIMTGGFSATEIDIEQAEVLRKYLGLDRPMLVRYGMWIWNLAKGDLGLSFQVWGGGESRQRPVRMIVGDRIWTTVVLTAFTIVVTWTFAIPVGIYSAVRQHSIGDYLFTFIGFSGLAVPDFLLGLVLMYVAYAYFDQSVGGLFSGDYANKPWSWGKALDMVNHLWVPAIVLGTSGTAGLIRVMRNNLLDELSKPYVVTARAKGVPPWKVILKYPVRVAANPLVSTIGYLLPSLVSGSVIVSVVLSLPTLGPIFLEAILQEDVYMSGFIVLLLGTLTVIGTLLSDILLAVTDPRIRLGQS